MGGPRSEPGRARIVESYEGAVQLLAAVIQGSQELREEILQRAQGRPRTEVPAIAAEVLWRIHRQAMLERAETEILTMVARATGQRFCTVCRRIRPLIAFRKDRGRWRSECIECHRRRDRNYKARRRLQ